MRAIRITSFYRFIAVEPDFKMIIFAVHSNLGEHLAVTRHHAVAACGLIGFDTIINKISTFPARARVLVPWEWDNTARASLVLICIIWRVLRAIFHLARKRFSSQIFELVLVVLAALLHSLVVGCLNGVWAINGEAEGLTEAMGLGADVRITDIFVEVALGVDLVVVAAKTTSPAGDDEGKASATEHQIFDDEELHVGLRSHWYGFFCYLLL